MITRTTSLQDLLLIATTTLSELLKGEVFTVKKLFRGFEWERISKGNRTKLGSMFLDYANNQGSGIIKPLGKTPQNQQEYKKL